MGSRLKRRVGRVEMAAGDQQRLAQRLFGQRAEHQCDDQCRGGQAEAPQGKADVLEVKGPEGSNFTARLFINSQSHQPIMLSWQMPPSTKRRRRR